MDIEKIDILGVKISKISFLQSLEKVKEFLNQNKTHYIVTPNPEIILASQKNRGLARILNDADLAIPDGAGLMLASKFQIKSRVTGTDLMLAMLNKFKSKKFKFILKSDGLTKIGDLEKKIKQQNILISENNPDIIFVGLGCPKQEQWIKNNLADYPSAKIFMTVGGGIDFLTGRQKRAPQILQSLSLEWLWRLIIQPQRFKRILNATIIFPFKVFFSAK